MAKPFKLMVLTPEREFYNGEAVYVGMDTIAGSIGVLADHVPMVTALTVGTLIIKPDEHTTRTAFHSEGFIEVRHDSVLVMAQACEWPEEIDVRRAEEAEKRAEQRISSPAVDERAMTRSKVALMRAMTRKRIKTMYNPNMK